MKAALAIFALLFLAGCNRPAAREDENPAPSSSMTKDEALMTAVTWSNGKPGRSFSMVAATGSMAPVLDSRSILLIEKATVSNLVVNDIAVYERDPTQLFVVHRVKEVRPDGVLFDGDNNHYSDGWVSPDKIRWRVAGILFTKR